MHRAAIACAFVIALNGGAARAQTAEQFPPEQIKRGAATFADYCSPCHGERMSNPELFNLRAFPKDQKSRFVNSVTNGKSAMPAWRGQLKPEDIEAIWSYVYTGEKD